MTERDSTPLSFNSLNSLRVGFVGFNGLELEALLAGLRFRTCQVFNLKDGLPTGVAVDAVLASGNAWEDWCSSRFKASSLELSSLPWLVLSGQKAPEAVDATRSVKPHWVDIRKPAPVIFDLVQGWLHRRLGSVDLPPPQRSIRDTGSLSKREKDVMALLQQGLSNEQIAEAMGIRVPTVKTYMRRIFERIGARNRAHAVALTGAWHASVSDSGARLVNTSDRPRIRIRDGSGGN